MWRPRALPRQRRDTPGRPRAGRAARRRAHPDFATNRWLYLSYVKPDANGYGNLAVARGRFENDRLSNIQDIFHASAPGNGTNRSSMWGGRLAFDHQGYLFVTLGDRQWPAVPDLTRHPAQDLLTHNGKTVRLHDDGRVPKDNPFVGRAHVFPEIWTLGHGTPKAWPLTRRPANSGRTSTARRAATNST